MEMNEYTPDLFTLEDEEGNEQEFELLDVMEYEGEKYYALTPYYGDQKEDMLEDDGEVVILKEEELEDGETMLVSIEEDDEYEKIGALFLERLNEIYGEEDEDEE